MPLFSQKEVLNLKLNSIPLPKLKMFMRNIGINVSGSKSEIIKELLNSGIQEKYIDIYIKQSYTEKIQERKKLISDGELKDELFKVNTFSWGVVQGQLDQKVQSEYVRKFVRYNEILSEVKAKLHNEITNYVICSWYNHWTTVLIEEHISLHDRVVPTIKNIKGIDIFFDGQPFDLKITYLPSNYNPEDALTNPTKLAIWMYENQGAQRFGADNRLFVVLLDKDNPERSWELKRDFELVYREIDNFFDKEKVSIKDEVSFSFGRKTYTAVTKILIITN